MTNPDQALALETLTAARPRRVLRILGPIAVALALLSAFVTFIVLAGLTRIVPTHDVVVTLLLINVTTVLALVAIIGWEGWQILQARRRGRAAARLHVRIVALFSLISAIPTILVSVVASVTLDRGLDTLFSRQTRALIENSVIVAQAYLNEQARAVQGDTGLMAFDLTRHRTMFDQDRPLYHKMLNEQALVRNFALAMIVNSQVEIVEQADKKVERNFITPSKETIQKVGDTSPEIGISLDENYIASIIKLRAYDDAYLFVVRLMDPVVAGQLRRTLDSIDEFTAVESRRLGVQIGFWSMYVIIALTVLLSAVWIGINFANYLVAPIRRLIGAAQAVSAGNLFVQVPTRRAEGDLANLGTTFNTMTRELRTQRDDIMRARDLIDSRRRFTEAVLAGASAGVIGVDPAGRVNILNRSAEKLIGCNEADALGRPLIEMLPELTDMLAVAEQGPLRLAQREITISRDGRERNLSVRVTSEHTPDAEHGYVVTLDDITELVSAQRTSAWADVARRIAHEIKNPLTPIQLSAERLRRKYGSKITEDPAIFQQCTDTIVRQVDDIKRMVDEFSRFARMPKAEMVEEDVADTVRQAAFLMRVGYPDIDIELETELDEMPARFDRRLISQALTNIIKNATEAISAVPDEELGGRGHIGVSAARDGNDIVIDVVDNGIGLPKENRNRLLEPYVTTREKGTGLGLAIVGRVLEEHGGKIELRDAALKIPGQRGAWVRLRFAAEIVGQGPPADAAKTVTP
ncbi:MAG TPA: PAS domain-containing sensor histidine kinase [Xanthobacteraceae bacterium]|nr:PAS domain-containing sensor histidine kinase [Xanthobacteraceae bacterium]